MKTPLIRFSATRNLTLLATLSSQLLLGCNTHRPTPESEGEKVGEYLCTKDAREDDALYARQAQVAADIKAGKITTHAQLIARYEALSKLQGPSDDLNVATVKRDSILAKLDADFPQRDERQAVGRVIDAYLERCTAAQEAKKKKRPDTHIRELVARFAVPFPQAPVFDSTGRELPPPVPEAPPEALSDRP